MDDGGVQCGERVVADPRESAEDVRREEMIVKRHSITLQLSVHTRQTLNHQPRPTYTMA